MTHGQKEESSSVCLMLVWAAMGQQEPFHTQSGAAFDQSMPGPDSYLKQTVFASLLEAQWLVSLSPYRPPLA